MRLAAYLLAFFLAASNSGCATTNHGETPDGAYRFEKPIETLLTGNWGGTLKSRPPFSTSVTAEQFQGDVGLKLKLGTDSAEVAVSMAGQSFDTADVMTRRLYTNAILKGYSIESDKESSGKDVAAWTIVLTAKTDDTIIAEWTEVRNFPSSRGAQARIKSYSAVGVLQRVPPP